MAADRAAARRRPGGALTWGSAACSDLAVLGRGETVRAWSDHRDCRPPHERYGWQIGIQLGEGADEGRVLDAVGQAQDAGLSVATAVIKVAVQIVLPRCALLIADGDQAAVLPWGLPLGVVDLGGGEHVVTPAPPAESSELWRPLPAGMSLALDPCGPTYMPIPFCLDLERE